MSFLHTLANVKKQSYGMFSRKFVFEEIGFTAVRLHCLWFKVIALLLLVVLPVYT